MSHQRPPTPCGTRDRRTRGTGQGQKVAQCLSSSWAGARRRSGRSPASSGVGRPAGGARTLAGSSKLRTESHSRAFLPRQQASCLTAEATSHEVPGGLRLWFSSSAARRASGASHLVSMSLTRPLKYALSGPEGPSGAPALRQTLCCGVERRAQLRLTERSIPGARTRDHRSHSGSLLPFSQRHSKTTLCSSTWWSK